MTQHSADKGLYHIRLIGTYVELLEKHYPEVDIDEVLGYAGLTRYELSDMGFWFSQDQADRFYEIVLKKTGNPNIALEAGQFEAISKSYDAVRLYVYGFLTPSVAYSLVEKIGNKVTRGGFFKTKSLSSNSYEIIATPAEGVKEKSYQCENRIGLFQSISQPFTGEFAKIDHPECIHRGGNCCRYIVTWNEPPWLKLKKTRNILILSCLMILGPLLYFMPTSSFIHSIMACMVIVGGMSLYIWNLEKRGLAEKIVEQSRSAELLLQETEKRYNEARLIQEIGQTISNTIKLEDLLKGVIAILERYLNYDCGMILLSNDTKTRLTYKAGFGFTEEQEKFFRNNSLHLDNPKSKGPFVVAFREKIPYLINDVNEITQDLSVRTRNLIEFVGTKSFICVPIVYENESLGILTVENHKQKLEPKQSDLNLLMGIAPQIAISMNNIKSFENLIMSEEKYRLLVESASSIILRLDLLGNITFINAFAQNFYGYRENEMVGRNALGFLIPPKDSEGRDTSKFFLDFIACPGNYHNFVNENVLKDGGRVWISWSTNVITDKDGSPTEILCVGNDITERNRAEEERKRLEVQLQRSQKMEAIGMLAGGVAHDLNNILSGIVSLPEILLMEIQEESPLRKTIEAIKRSGEKAAAIVQDLLTLARRGVSVSNPININTILNDYFRSPEYTKLKEYHPLIHVSLHLENDLLNIMGSGIHLSKTIMNLITNAMEAMPKGGDITVKTENRYLEVPIQGYDLIEKGEYAVLSIKDTGIGISQEDTKRIFEPFYSKKVMGRSGTGLGMAVIWSTVKDHRGFIDVESKVGVGTRFDLYFPATREEIVNKEPSKSLDMFRGSEKILVIDDMPDQQEIARKILEKLGYTVKTVSSGEEALDYLRDSAADLVVLDMIMDPGMDGLEAYRNILNINPAQRAIIVSGYSETDRVRDTLDLGAGAYVRKPYLLHEIARAVRTELDKKV